jgi:metalloendopeptidase OMA1, mitochondrial
MTPTFAHTTTRSRAAALLAFALFLTNTSACSMPSRDDPGENAGPGGREQPLALSPKQELAVGRRAYQEVMAEVGDRVLPPHSPEVIRVRRVTDRLVQAAEIEPLQREMLLRVRGYRFEWEANVIRDARVNAFCLPAGRLFVYSGLLRTVGERDDGLAAVIAHEMAHALAHHGSERVAREQQGGNVFRRLSYDRLQESEADHIGVFLMTFAGYDPDQAVAFWERMRHSSKSGVPEFLSDHPSDEHRAQALRDWAPRARAAKKAFDEGRIARSR